MQTLNRLICARKTFYQAPLNPFRIRALATSSYVLKSLTWTFVTTNPKQQPVRYVRTDLWVEHVLLCLALCFLLVPLSQKRMINVSENVSRSRAEPVSQWGNVQKATWGSGSTLHTFVKSNHLVTQIHSHSMEGFKQVLTACDISQLKCFWLLCNF